MRFDPAADGILIERDRIKVCVQGFVHRADDHRGGGDVAAKTQILENVFDLEGDFVDENTIAVNITSLPSSGRDEIILVSGRGRLKNSLHASALIALWTVLSDFGMETFNQGLYLIRTTPRSSSLSSISALLNICLKQVGYISFALFVNERLLIHLVKTEDDK